LPDISKINNVAVADISKLDSITFADGQKVNNQSVSLVTDAHTLIATAASDGSDASLGFTSGINSTYDVYEFHFTNIHTQNNDTQFTFQVNDSGDEGGAYDESPITSTFITSYQKDDNITAHPSYPFNENDYDLSNTADYKIIQVNNGNSDEHSLNGVLTLFAPSSTTYVKHFMSDIVTNAGTYSRRSQASGYINDTTDITQINFKFNSGEIQGGNIKMYGVVKS
jgi:hypothetical protein